MKPWLKPTLKAAACGGYAKLAPHLPGLQNPHFFSNIEWYTMECVFSSLSNNGAVSFC